MDNRHCRFCGRELKFTLADLGLSPMANEYLRGEDIDKGQRFYPLRVNVCDRCFLVQAEAYQLPEQIFKEYGYFSSNSNDWLQHSKKYVDTIVPRLGLTPEKQVLEIACNDGYLLQYFLPYNVPVIGVEPAENIAKIAREKGINVESCFFGSDSAKEIVAKYGKFDLVIGNNVLAHVPDIGGFVSGLATALNDCGTITMEFPHLLQMIRACEFDTIYHEHFYYLSLLAVQNIFRKYGLLIYDVEELSTHGGSIRIYAAHKEYGEKHLRDSVAALLEKEREAGLDDIHSYKNFSDRMLQIKAKTITFLAEARSKGKRVAAVGAAAKGNTFLNYCGIKRDMIDFVIDTTPYKQGLYLPGSLVPIVPPESLMIERPDYLLILPWNWRDEAIEKNKAVREWGCKFVTCIPELQIIP